MIVIGVDVHKKLVTAVAVDEAGRPLDERVISVGSDELLGWASSLAAERLWAVEDCRPLTRWLERLLLERAEELVRVPPKLTVPERRAGRTRGKSDPIDALAIARAALREPDLSRPRPGEQVFRDLKRLVDHRDDLVDARRRMQQRLRWHLHALDPTFVVPLRKLDRPLHLERVGRWLTRQEQELQVRLARELVARCRTLNREIAALNQELEQRTSEIAPALLELPGCAAVTRPSCSPRSVPSSASEATRNSPDTAASHRSKQAQAAPSATGSTAAATASFAALYRIAITQSRYHPDARAYLERKRAERKSRREAIRCLKRLLVRVVYQTLKASPALT
jgi:transposase